MKKIVFLVFLLSNSLLMYSQDTTNKPKPTFWDKVKASVQGDTAAKTARKEAMTLPTDASTNKVSFEEVVDAPGSQKKKMFDNAKKWMATQTSPVHPYTVSYESAEEGSIVGNGTLAIPSEHKKYVFRFAIKISMKDGKFKYEITDMVVQLRTNAGSSGGGYGGFGGSSYHEAEVLEYSLETFYPSRLSSRKPAIRYFEEIDDDSFVAIKAQMKSVTSSLKQAMLSKDDW